ncbi:CLUMA_CG004407, isoform A [Clunio marinus]|uniref:CLUMA_CG004407, isoform A n=1 Tax=Clunio marinus TaxID=568069 RepID=A0A1J1HT34_9DIPT|nr:CLUMA_CG004407, isoform A [Clunio marinus]
MQNCFQRCLITMNEFPQLPDFLTPLSLLTFGRSPFLFCKIAYFTIRQTTLFFLFIINTIVLKLLKLWNGVCAFNLRQIYACGKITLLDFETCLSVGNVCEA